MCLLKVNLLFSSLYIEILTTSSVTSSIKLIVLVTVLVVLSQINSQMSMCMCDWACSLVPLVLPQDKLVLCSPLVQGKYETQGVDLSTIYSLELSPSKILA